MWSHMALKAFFSTEIFLSCTLAVLLSLPVMEPAMYFLKKKKEYFPLRVESVPDT